MVFFARILRMQSGARGRIPMIRFRKGAPPDHKSASQAAKHADTIVVGGVEMKIINPDCVHFPLEKPEELQVPQKYKRQNVCSKEIDRVNTGGAQ